MGVIRWIPEPPGEEGMPSNYCLQLCYEDITMTGNQKSTEFDESTIDEKFVIPLLSSNKAKFEIMGIEDSSNSQTAFDRGTFDLQESI